MSWNYNRISREKGLRTKSLEMFRDSLNSSFMTLRFTFWCEGATWKTHRGKAKGIRDWKTHLCCDSFAIFISFLWECWRSACAFLCIKSMRYYMMFNTCCITQADLYTHESDHSYFWAHLCTRQHTGAQGRFGYSSNILFKYNYWAVLGC